jgi:hypothetical protein
VAGRAPAQPDETGPDKEDAGVHRREGLLGQMATGKLEGGLSAYALA